MSYGYVPSNAPIGQVIEDLKLWIEQNFQRISDDMIYESPGPLYVDSAALGDGKIGKSRVNIWVDETGNTLSFKVKYSDGTVKSGTVALT